MKSRCRKQPPRQLHDTDDEAGLSPQVRVITKMLADIKTMLADHDTKLTKLPPHLTIPTDKESPEEEASVKPQRRPIKPTTGKLCTADNTVITDITWPHEVIFTSDGKPAVYDELSAMVFVKGDLTVKDSQDIKNHMNSHLQDLMEDG